MTAEQSPLDALLRDLEECNLTSQQALSLRILLHTLDAVAMAVELASTAYHSQALSTVLASYQRLIHPANDSEEGETHG